MALIGTGSALIWLVAPVGLFIGTIGTIGVVKAAYIDKRELTCACVGGDSKVPLGFISLSEPRNGWNGHLDAITSDGIKEPQCS